MSENDMVIFLRKSVNVIGLLWKGTPYLYNCRTKELMQIDNDELTESAIGPGLPFKYIAEIQDRLSREKSVDGFTAEKESRAVDAMRKFPHDDDDEEIDWEDEWSKMAMDYTSFRFKFSRASELIDELYDEIMDNYGEVDDAETINRILADWRARINVYRYKIDQADKDYEEDWSEEPDDSPGPDHVLMYRNGRREWIPAGDIRTTSRGLVRIDGRVYAPISGRSDDRFVRADGE